MSTMSPEQVGAAIRAARLHHHWSQNDLANHAGVSREWVCKAEGGAPRLDFDKVLGTFAALGFNILAPDGCLITEVEVGKGEPKRRVSSRARSQALAEIEKGQQLAGHSPSEDALARAQRVLDGELAPAQARAEVRAKVSN
jgi:transcriptional regulator with XRE-family HTH domain